MHTSKTSITGRQKVDDQWEDVVRFEITEEHPGISALASALILQACRDYCHALLNLRKTPESRHDRHLLAETEEFFHSDLFALLTDISPEYLLRKLKATPEAVLQNARGEKHDAR